MPTCSRFDRRRFMRILGASAGCLSVSSAARLARAAEEASESLAIEDYFPTFAERAELGMRFTGRTADECRAWQATFAAKLRELMGPTEPPKTWRTNLETTVELSDHTREERVLSADGLAPVPFHLLIPRDTSGPRPLILALHGHGDFGHESITGVDTTPERRAEIDKYRYDYGLRFVQRGYVVAAPCLAPFGRRKDAKSDRRTACDHAFLQLLICGKILQGENVRDVRWTLEEALRHPRVDGDRVACVGLSYGGRTTMFTTALEPRIKAAVISGALNCLQERAMSRNTSGCQLVPGLLEFGDTPEVGSLIAPRPAVWETGRQDRNMMIPGWTERAMDRMARAYTALGAADNLRRDTFDGGHQWNGEVAYPILEKALA